VRLRLARRIVSRRRAVIFLAVVVVVLGAAIAASVVLRRAASAGAADASDAALVALGADIYAAQCARCHGARLEGQPDWQERLPSGRLPAPPHDASGHTWHHPDEQLFKITKDGLGALVPGYETDMPAYKGVLSDREIWAVLAYIKSTWPEEIRARQERISAQRR
jgi:mono/diheme cytochrome c family protein